MKHFKKWLAALTLLVLVPATGLAINTSPKAPPVFGPIVQNWVQWAVWVFRAIVLIFFMVGLIKWILAVGSGRSAKTAIAMTVAALATLAVSSDLQGWVTKLIQLFNP